MIDRIEAVAAPQETTPYVRPSASIFTVEGGEHVLHVVRGREEALALLDAKRARTRDERFALSREIIEASVLPERADAGTVTVASTELVMRLMDATFDVMPHLERVKALVFAETQRLDAFVIAPAPALSSGYGVVRTRSGPLLETFHSLQQAAAFLRRHEAMIGDAEMEAALDTLGHGQMAVRSSRSPEAFGGFAAAVIGARDRLLWEIGARPW